MADCPKLRKRKTPHNSKFLLLATVGRVNCQLHLFSNFGLILTATKYSFWDGGVCVLCGSWGLNSPIRDGD